MLSQEEKESILKLTPFFSENPVIFDVGSNKGHFTDLMLDEFGGGCDLHLFEPNQKLLSYTEIKYEYRKNITYNCFALGREKGEKDFYYFENENNELSSLVKGDDWGELPMKVKTVGVDTVSRYVLIGRNIPVIDCLKIDCEGTDPDVVYGCKDMMRHGEIKFIIIEYSPHYNRADQQFKHVISAANAFGYKVYYYTSGNFWEVKIETFVEDYRFENFIITKENIHNYSDGWNKEFVLNTIELPKFEMVLEVGSFEGLTTRYMCDNLIENGRVVCVDPMKDYYTPEDTEHTEMFKQQYQRFCGNTRGLPIELIRKESKDALPELNALRFGLCYVDGDHREDAVYFDASWCFAITKIGGYILFDDYGWRDETARGIDRFLNEFGGSLEIVSKGYQVLVKKISNQYNDLTYEYYK